MKFKFEIELDLEISRSDVWIVFKPWYTRFSSHIYSQYIIKIKNRWIRFILIKMFEIEFDIDISVLNEWNMFLTWWPYVPIPIYYKDNIKKWTV